MAKKYQSSDKTAERILLAATRLFAAKGYDGTSTNEICKAAGVNVAAVHYHFKSKEALLRSILETFGSLSLRAVQRILTSPTTKEEFQTRLRIFLEEILDSYLQHPEHWSIIQSEAVLMHPRTSDLFRTFFVKRTEALVTFFTQAKKRGLLSKKIDPAVISRNLFSQVCHQARMAEVFQTFYNTSFKIQSYRELWLEQTLEQLFFGISGK